MKNKKYKDSASRAQKCACTNSAEALPILERKFKDSGIPWIGMIPEDWTIEQIGRNIAEVDNPNSDCAESNALQFKAGTIISKSQGDSKYHPDTLAAYNIVEEGDIMLNGLNLSFDMISQRVGLVCERGVITSAYLAIRPNENINSEYLTYLFKAYDAKKALHSMGRGLRQTLSYKELKRYSVVFPPLPTQQRIADFLDRKCAEIDELSALQETMIAELKRYKQSVITEAVTKGLDKNVKLKDSGVEWIGKIPEGWEVGRMKNVCFQNPNSISEKENADYTFRYVDIGSVSFEKGIYKSEQYCFKDAPSRARRRANYGDFIMSTVRTYLKAIDVIDTDEKASFIYSTGFAVLTPFDNISFKFLSYMSKSSNFLEQVSILSKGINYPSINSADLMTIHIVIPPLSEQQAIADYLDEKCSEIDELIAIKQQKIEQLKEYKKSVIFEYVTGKKEI